MKEEPMRPPPLAAIPPDVVAVDDYEPLARERLDPAIWAYVAGGAADELALRENRTVFQRRRIVPRLFGDFSEAHTRVELFGRIFEHPILVAPMAFHRLFHPEGERASVLGAGAMEAAVVVSTQASLTVEEIAAAACGPLWFQLYIQPDREFTLELVRRAERAGYEALVVTADAPLTGLRNREQRAGFALPPGIEAVNLRGMRTVPPADRVFESDWVKKAPGWRDLEWLRSQTRLPLLVKGVVHPDDAARAVEVGADGLVVSNHGGRGLDAAPAALDALPDIVARVGTQVPVLIDGGIRRGTDVFQAIALGATAVMVGRPCLFGLAAAGAVGVAHVLRILRAELEAAMVLAGCPTLAVIGPESLTFPPTGGADCDTRR